MRNTNPQSVKNDMSVLKNFRDPGREHVFLFMAPTIEDQLKNCDRLLNELNNNVLNVMNTNEDILSLLNEHKNEVMESAESFEKDNLLMAVKSKAPSPCPGGASSCLLNALFLDYFDPECSDELKLFKNEELIEAETVSYDELTKIRTVKLAKKLIYTDEDSVRLEMPVTIHNEDGSAVIKIFTEQISGSGN